MMAYLDKLGLQPHERRLVVIVAVVIFIVINWVFVFPVFGELGKTQQLIGDKQKLLAMFKQEVDKKQEYQKKNKELEDLGFFIPLEEQITAFSREVQTKATLSGIKLPTVVPGSPGTTMGTNAFFEEQSLVISVGNTTRPRELVTFLHNLSKDNSLIRVSSMTLRPDPTHIYLFGNMTLIKSFQRKAPARPAASPTSVASTGATNQSAAPKTASSVSSNTPPPAVVQSNPPSSRPAAAPKPNPRSAPTNATTKRTMPNPPPPK